MEAILKFKLPEDNPEFQLAVNAVKWYSVAWDIDQYLRGQTKHAPDDMPEEEYKALVRVREELYRIINENGVSFDA